MINQNLIVEDFLGECVENIYLFFEDINDINQIPIQTTKIIISFQDKTIIISPITETDEIDVVLKPIKFYPSKSMFYKIYPLSNNKLNYIWNGVNNMGYSDMLCFSFFHLHPSIIILSEANKLLLFECNPISNNRIISS